MRIQSSKFKNILAEMVRANISVNILATKMGITKQALYNKLNGSNQFLYKDIRAIQQILQELNNNKYTLDYLFTEYDNQENTE